MDTKLISPQMFLNRYLFDTDIQSKKEVTELLSGI